MIFSKVVPRPLGMLKQVFLGRFEPVVARFGSWKIPKCLENGPFWDQQWVKNGSKTRLSENDPGPFDMLKQVVLAHFEPVATGFGSWKIPICLENGPFWDQKREDIYYYTPLPLNLANKQQQATTTTRHHFVLAIAPSHRLELDSYLAILEPRWWPCQIQVLSQKLTGGGLGRWRQVGRCPPKSAQFWAKNSHFSPKTAPVRVQNSQTKANGCYTTRAA